MLMRKVICAGLKVPGVEIDQEINARMNDEGIISTKESKIKVLVVPTNEELMMAREAFFLNKTNNTCFDNKFFNLSNEKRVRESDEVTASTEKQAAVTQEIARGTVNMQNC